MFIIQVDSDCRVLNETAMFCRAPPWLLGNIPALVQLGVKNRFGIISLIGNHSIEIVEDPIISNFTETLVLTSKLTYIQIPVSILLAFKTPH